MLGGDRDGTSDSRVQVAQCEPSSCSLKIREQIYDKGQAVNFTHAGIFTFGKTVSEEYNPPRWGLVAFAKPVDSSLVIAGR